MDARFTALESALAELHERQALGLAAEIQAREEVAFRTDALAESLPVLASRLTVLESALVELRSGVERQREVGLAEIRARRTGRIQSRRAGRNVEFHRPRLRMLETVLEELRTGTQRHTAEIQAEIQAREQVALRADAIAEGLRDVDRRLTTSGDLALRIRQLEEYNHSTRRSCCCNTSGWPLWRA